MFGEEKAPPKRGFSISQVRVFAEAFPQHAGIGSRRKPRRSGASVRVISLRKEGVGSSATGQFRARGSVPSAPNARQQSVTAEQQMSSAGLHPASGEGSPTNPP